MASLFNVEYPYTSTHPSEPVADAYHSKPPIVLAVRVLRFELSAVVRDFPRAASGFGIDASGQTIVARLVFSLRKAIAVLEQLEKERTFELVGDIDPGETMAVQWIESEVNQWKQLDPCWTYFTVIDRFVLQAVFEDWERCIRTHRDKIQALFSLHANNFNASFTLADNIRDYDYDRRLYWHSQETSARTRLLLGSAPGCYDAEMTCVADTMTDSLESEAWSTESGAYEQEISCDSDRPIYWGPAGRFHMADDGIVVPCTDF